MLVTGDAYINTDLLGNPITYETRRITRTAYNGSLVNAVFLYNGLLPNSNYQIQVNASNRAGFIMSNIVSLSTLPGGKFYFLYKTLRNWHEKCYQSINQSRAARLEPSYALSFLYDVALLIIFIRVSHQSLNIHLCQLNMHVDGGAY